MNSGLRQNQTHLDMDPSLAITKQNCVINEQQQQEWTPVFLREKSTSSDHLNYPVLTENKGLKLLDIGNKHAHRFRPAHFFMMALSGPEVYSRPTTIPAR